MHPQVVRAQAKIVCRCHGVTTSCNMKTCQREISEFRVIGDALHKKYDNAVRVKLEKKNDKKVSKKAKNVHLVVKRKKNGDYRRDNSKLRSTNKRPAIDTMVYLRDSPDYCVRNEFPGTGGRECSTESYGSDSCDELCCGRGYRSMQVVTKSRCRCKFHWCCEIRCKECTKVETKHMCRS